MIRKRGQGSASSLSDSSSRSLFTSPKRTNSSNILLACLTGILCIIFYFSTKNDSLSMPSGIRISEKSNGSSQLDLLRFESCKVSFQPPPPKESWTTKTFFVPSYPDAMDDKLVKNIFEGLTGSPVSARTYYAQGSTPKGKYRRCQGPQEQAACLLVHPVIPLKPPPDDPKFTKRFDSKVIMLIRNPKTQIPAHANVKAIKYHGLEGQQPEAEWRSFRDSWLKNMLTSWQNSIREWTSLSHYKVALFIPVEGLFEVERGPQLLRKVAALLREAGYTIADDSDIDCIWYRAIGNESIRQFRKYKYEFSDYTPKYTKEGKSMIIEALKNVTKTISQAEDLTAIINEYIDDVENNTILE